MRWKQGIVTGTSMQKTVVVTVHREVFHPIYKKRFKRSHKFLADAGEFDLGIGDIVVITECKPLSKRKHFRVTELLEQAPRVSDIKEEGVVEEILGAKEKKEKEEKAPSPVAS